MSDLSKQPFVILRMENFNSCQFLSILLFDCFYFLGYCIFLMSTLHSYMHGVNTISGAYTVFGLCFRIILHFTSNQNTFGMDLGSLVYHFFPLYFLIGWLEDARDYQGY